MPARLDEPIDQPIPVMQPGSTHHALWLAGAVVIVLGGAVALYLRIEGDAPTTASATAPLDSPALPAIGSGLAVTSAPPAVIPREPDPDAVPRLVPIDDMSVRSDAPVVPPDARLRTTTRSIEEIVSRSASAVVLIRASNSTGTGFFVTQDLLLTNAHVVRVRRS